MLAELCALSLLAAHPQEVVDPFSWVSVGETRVGFFGQEMQEEEANQFATMFENQRRAYQEFLGIVPPGPTIRIRVRDNAVRQYYTDGQNNVFFDFPNPGYFRPIQPRDERVYGLARPVLAQLWLHQMLTSMAGLDSRITASIAGYVDYLEGVYSGLSDGSPPAGTAQVWYLLDSIYQDGLASFVLNSLIHEQIPAYRLGGLLRQIAVDATEDPEAASLFNFITPETSIYALEEHEPGEPILEGSTLRPSRMALQNGVRIMDQSGNQLTAADRIRDFDSLVLLLSRTYPDNGLSVTPPTINGKNAWDLYFEFRPRVLRARDNVDFYLVMREFAATVRDRWVSVMSSHGMANWKGVTGLSVEASEGNVFVSEVGEDSEAAARGVKPSMQILEIDGRDVHDVWTGLKDYFTYAASSNSNHEAQARALNVLLTGPEDQPAVLKLLPSSASDEAQELAVTLKRGAPKQAGAGAAASPEIVHSEVLPSGHGLIRIETFTGNAVGQFVQSLNELMTTAENGIVLDLRGNPGGDPVAAKVVLGRLTDQSTAIAESHQRDPERPDGHLLSQPINVNPLPPTYDGPCALLIDEWTAGPAELIALGFGLSNRGPILGRTSSGNGTRPILPPQPYQTLTSSGITVSLVSTRFTQRGGQELQGVGVAPTTEVKRTPKDMKNGVDRVLQTAIDALE